MIVPHNTQNYMYLALLYTTYLYSNKDLKKNDQSNTERILINTYITIQVLFFSFTYHNA
ncbi:putative exported protein [Ehrlichia ruminantium]|uniref:Putative exported protein n=1 Tax=Ehrlichia ruminantium TaxID=779 RepID=A0A170TA17_EHRRU|nr:putative exported protein [Ehrlichia ruminantium]GAT78707.1 putative exported protein [Ehrlichia ruminantium]